MNAMLNPQRLKPALTAIPEVLTIAARPVLAQSDVYRPLTLAPAEVGEELEGQTDSAIPHGLLSGASAPDSGQSADEVARQWTVPLIVVVSKTILTGKMPTKIELEVNYDIERSDVFAPKWLPGINLTPVVPHIFERWNVVIGVAGMFSDPEVQHYPPLEGIVTVVDAELAPTLNGEMSAHAKRQVPAAACTTHDC